MVTKILSTPLDLGKEIQVIKTEVSGAYSETFELSADAEAVLVSLFVNTTAGDVDVQVLTEGAAGHDVEVIAFPTISAPSTDLLLKKSASILRKVRIRVTTTDSAEFEVRVRGVSAGASSVTIEGSASFTVSQEDVTTTPGVLIASALVDRRGILIRNNNTGTEILYIAETLAKATSATAYPVASGGNITIDLKAGVTIYAVASSGTIDTRIVQVGGD